MINFITFELEHSWNFITACMPTKLSLFGINCCSFVCIVNDKHQNLLIFTHFNWREIKKDVLMKNAFLVVHAVMTVAIIAEKIVAHTHSGVFPAILSYLQTWESIYCLKNCQIGVNKNWNSSMKSCQPSLFILYADGLSNVNRLTDWSNWSWKRRQVKSVTYSFKLQVFFTRKGNF